MEGYAGGVLVRDEKVPQGPTEGTPVLVCFPSAGLASTIVAHYVVRAKELPRCATFQSPFLPSATVVIDSLPNPPVRAYGDSHVAVVVSEFPAPMPLVTPLAISILHWVQSRRAGPVVAVEGILHRQEDGEQTQEEDTILGIPSNAAMKDRLKGAKIKLLEEGVVGGIPADLLNEASAQGQDAAVLFVTAHSADYPDHRAAARLLETLDRLLPSLELDPKPLMVQAEVIEKALREGMKFHKEPPKTEAPAREIEMLQ